MRTSARGLGLIAEFEGIVLKPYNDAAGHATIGVGHLLHRGAVTDLDRRAFLGFDREDAMKLLARDVRAAEAAVNRYVRVPINQHRFDALVSLTFNIGAGALLGSTLLAKLNQGDYPGVPAQFMRWTRAGGRELAGLVRRRKAEVALWNRRTAT